MKDVAHLTYYFSLGKTGLFRTEFEIIFDLLQKARIPSVNNDATVTASTLPSISSSLCCNRSLKKWSAKKSKKDENKQK
jgi:hypothetical protein